MTRILTLTMNPSLDIATSIEHVRDTVKLRCAPEESHPGGGGINVSRIIHNMGGDSIAMFPCGGYTGDRLQQLLIEEDLTTHIFPISSNTRQSFSIHESATTKDYRFLLPGHTLDQATATACLDYIRNLKSKPHFLVASGSLPPGISDDFYADVSRLAQSMSCHFVLDTSGAALKHAIQAGGIYLFKPSLEELEELTGQALPTQEMQIHAARALIDARKTEVIVISLGSKGALLITEKLVLKAQGPTVQPVSSVGAGDSLVGGVIWALEQNASIERALRYGIASACATIMHPHGEMGSREMIEMYLEKIQISKL